MFNTQTLPFEHLTLTVSHSKWIESILSVFVYIQVCLLVSYSTVCGINGTKSQVRCLVTKIY